jgi:hypothetical protein
MDDFHQQETKFFLNRARARPLFLFRHCKSLANIIFDRYKTKVLVKLRGQHRGTKKTPAWLKLRDNSGASTCKDVSRLRVQIPRRDIFNSVLEFPHVIPAAHMLNTSADPETYLATQRWSILIDDYLSKPATWNLPTQIKQFIDNPPAKTDAAWETYSCCERVANLLTWLSCIQLPARESVVTPAILLFLETSTQWILRHLEFYGKRTGNHILNNARALIMAGTVLHYPLAVATGKAILTRMLPILIQKNGFLRERSSHYQLIILTWLEDAKYFLQQSHFETSDILDDTIKTMQNAARMICDGAGNLQACIGDISPDLSPLKTSQRLSLFYPCWLPVTPEAKITQRDDWWTIQNNNNKILLNCPNGTYPQSHSSHAHNDITSFVWLHNQMPILIDSGRCRYTKDTISTRQKSALGHSLAFVNGFSPLCESFVVNGNWWPTPYAKATINVAATAANSLTITHDGFKRATPVTQHQRNILLVNNQLAISDHFAGTGAAQIDLHWQLAPASGSFDEEKLIVKIGETIIEIDLSQMSMQPEITFHGITPPVSWYSAEYGCAQPHPVLIMRWAISLPFSTNIIFRIKSCVV